MHNLKLTGVNASRILDAQKQSETEAQRGETKRNHIQAPSLFDALTRLQEAKDDQTVERLAGEYNLEGRVLRELGKIVNVPTPDETTARAVVDEDGAEVVLKTVRLICQRDAYPPVQLTLCSPGEMGDLPGPQTVKFGARQLHVKSQVLSGSNLRAMPRLSDMNLTGGIRASPRLHGPTDLGRPILILRTSYRLHLLCSFNFV